MDPVQVQKIKTKLDSVLVNNGEAERLKAVLKARLMECGWKDEVRLSCNKIIREQGVENIDINDLIREVTPIGREKVPAHIKKELLLKIQVAVTKEVEDKFGRAVSPDTSNAN